MSTHGNTGRPQRHRTGEPSNGLPTARYVAAGLLAAGVLGAGLVLGFGDFLGRPDASQAAALPVRMSMAGFDPEVITGQAGGSLTLELWTTDAAPHLSGGVHTLISDDLDIYETLAAESRRTLTLHLPPVPGDYDIYCDTCCGGKQSPTMHAILRVEA